MDQSVANIMRYFEFSHLSENLQIVAREYYGFAHALEQNLPTGPEKSVALRKLLESKDAAVRSALDA